MTEVWNAYDLNRNQLPYLLVRGEKIPEGQFHLCVNILATMSSEQEGVCWLERIVRLLHYVN